MIPWEEGGGGGRKGVVNPKNGQYGEDSPERGPFFRFQVCKMIGIS